MLEFARTMLSIVRQWRASSSGMAATTCKSSTRASTLGAVLLSASALLTSSTIDAADTSTAATDFQIPAESLAEALSKFGSQSGMQVVYAPDLARGLRSRPLSGRRTVDAALEHLLEGTGLTWSYVNANTIILKRTGPKKVSADGPKSDSGPAPLAVEEITVFGRIPEVLVYGSRSLNADIRRTEDDPQPYVVFGREEIERSMTGNLEEFIKTRLPMNTVQGTASQRTSSSSGNLSAINLRGLGENQTLILVNGRRMPMLNAASNGFRQADINGIPLAAIERIEVLPSTASGIYGGGATGGVINIITRQDYVGVDLKANYGSSFRGDAANHRFDGSAGFSLENGATHVLVSGSYSGSDPLLVGDRDLAVRGRARLLANNPNGLATPTTPPAGYTSNIRSQNGSNLVLDNNTPLNSPITFVPAGYTGPAADQGAALVANAGRYNFDLSDDLFGARQSLVVEPTVKAASLSLRRAFGSRVEAFIDYSHLDNEALSFPNLGAPLSTSVTLGANAPNNPFTTPILVTFPSPNLSFPAHSDSETGWAAGGAIVRLPRNWTLAAEYVWSRSRTSFIGTNPVVGDPDGTGPGVSASTALTNGTALNVVRDLNLFPLDWSPYLLASPNVRSGPNDTVLKNATLRLSGPVSQLPSGPITLSSLVEHREEEALDAFSDSVSGTTGMARSIFTPRRSQTVRSYYIEGRAPLVAESARRPLLHILELQVSVRRDEYETRAPTPVNTTLTSRQDALPALTYSSNKVEATKHTLGLRYAPVQDVTLRASYGTGFLPPSIHQIVPSVQANSTRILADPKRGGASATVAPITLTTGGSPDLVPEDSESWSAGMIFTPRFLPGLRLSLDYTHIEKIDEIVFLSEQQLLNLEDSLPGRVTRAPLTAADVALGYTGGAITAIDASNVNVASTRLEAYDVQADYTLRTARFGDLDFYIVGTWQPQLERQTLPDSAVIEFVGSDFSGPLKWRGNAGLSWSKGPWDLAWSTQYFHSYSACIVTATPAQCATTQLNQGSARVPSQTYHDVLARFRFNDSARLSAAWLRNTEISLGVQNVFDKSPPILGTTNVSAYSLYGDPRLRRYSFTVSKRL